MFVYRYLLLTYPCIPWYPIHSYVAPHGTTHVHCGPQRHASPVCTCVPARVYDGVHKDEVESAPRGELKRHVEAHGDAVMASCPHVDTAAHACDDMHEAEHTYVPLPGLPDHKRTLVFSVWWVLRKNQKPRPPNHCPLTHVCTASHACESVCECETCADVFKQVFKSFQTSSLMTQRNSRNQSHSMHTLAHTGRPHGWPLTPALPAMPAFAMPSLHTHTHPSQHQPNHSTHCTNPTNPHIVPPEIIPVAQQIAHTTNHVWTRPHGTHLMLSFCYHSPVALACWGILSGPHVFHISLTVGITFAPSRLPSDQTAL